MTERGIPQGEKLILNASKIKDLKLVDDAPATSDGKRRKERGRGGQHRKRDKEAFGSTGGGDEADESFTEDFDFAASNAQFNKNEDFAQFKVRQPRTHSLSHCVYSHGTALSHGGVPNHLHTGHCGCGATLWHLQLFCGCNILSGAWERVSGLHAD